MARCLLCNMDFVDLLMHLVLSHDIEDIEHFESEVQKAKGAEDRKRGFHEYVAQLHDQRRERAISGEQYRELVSKWMKDHA